MYIPLMTITVCIMAHVAKESVGIRTKHLSRGRYRSMYRRPPKPQHLPQAAMGRNSPKLALRAVSGSEQGTPIKPMKPWMRRQAGRLRLLRAWVGGLRGGRLFGCGHHDALPSPGVLRERRWP